MGTGSGHIDAGHSLEEIMLRVLMVVTLEYGDDLTLDIFVVHRDFRCLPVLLSNVGALVGAVGTVRIHDTLENLKILCVRRKMGDDHCAVLRGHIQSLRSEPFQLLRTKHMVMEKAVLWVRHISVLLALPEGPEGVENDVAGLCCGIIQIIVGSVGIEMLIWIRFSLPVEENGASLLVVQLIAIVQRFSVDLTGACGTVMVAHRQQNILLGDRRKLFQQDSHIFRKILRHETGGLGAVIAARSEEGDRAGAHHLRADLSHIARIGASGIGVHMDISGEHKPDRPGGIRQFDAVYGFDGIRDFLAPACGNILFSRHPGKGLLAFIQRLIDADVLLRAGADQRKAHIGNIPGGIKMADPGSGNVALLIGFQHIQERTHRFVHRTFYQHIFVRVIENDMQQMGVLILTMQTLSAEIQDISLSHRDKAGHTAALRFSDLEHAADSGVVLVAKAAEQLPILILRHMQPVGCRGHKGLGVFVNIAIGKNVLLFPVHALGQVFHKFQHLGQAVIHLRSFLVFLPGHDDRILRLCGLSRLTTTWATSAQRQGSKQQQQSQFTSD